LSVISPGTAFTVGVTAVLYRTQHVTLDPDPGDQQQTSAYCQFYVTVISLGLYTLGHPH